MATSSEWKSLSDSIEYKGLKSVLAESLYTSLCFSDQSCNNLNSNLRPTHYGSSILKLPTANDIEHKLLRQMNLTWIDRLQQWIKSKAAYLAFAVLTYNIIMFILHIIDLCTGNNPNNIFRTTFSLLWRLIVRLAQFFEF